MKKCPFCAEEIQDEAIKCKHCGEMLPKTGQPPAVQEQRRTKPKLTVLICIGLAAGLVVFVLWKIHQLNADSAKQTDAIDKRVLEQERRR